MSGRERDRRRRSEGDDIGIFFGGGGLTEFGGINQSGFGGVELEWLKELGVWCSERCGFLGCSGSSG